MATREQIEKEIEDIKTEMALISCEECDICGEGTECWNCDTNEILLDLEDELELLEKKLKRVK